MDKQVISKQRVVDHGEVLTGKREVNAMLDLVVLREGGIAVMVIQDQTRNFGKTLTSFRTIVDWCDNAIGKRHE